MTKKIKIALLISGLITILLCIGCVLLYYPFFIDKYDFNNHIITAYNSDIGEKNNKLYQIGDGFDLFVKDFVNEGKERKYQFVNTKMDPFDQIVSIVRNYPSDEGKEKEQIGHAVDIYYFSRIGINSFDLVDYRSNIVSGLTFQQTVDLVSRYDITTDFPGKENYKITNYSPLSQEDIERNRISREMDILFDEESELTFSYFYSLYDTFDPIEYGRNETKTIVLYENLDTLLIELTKAKESLTNNRHYTFPDSSTIQPTEQNKNKLNTFIDLTQQELLKVESRVDYIHEYTSSDEFLSKFGEEFDAQDISLLRDEILPWFEKIYQAISNNTSYILPNGTKVRSNKYNEYMALRKYLIYSLRLVNILEDEGRIAESEAVIQKAEELSPAYEAVEQELKRKP